MEKVRLDRMFDPQLKNWGLDDPPCPVLLRLWVYTDCLYVSAVKMEQKERHQAEEKYTFQLEHAKQEVDR